MNLFQSLQDTKEPEQKPVQDNTSVEKTNAEESAEKREEVVITKEMMISEVIQRKPRTIQTLVLIGMGDIGCPSSLMETVEQAAWVHGIDPEMLVQKLNEC